MHLALSHCLAVRAVSRRPRGGSAAARSDRRARELVVSGDSDSRCGFLVRRVSFNDSPTGKLRRERARPLEWSQPMPAPANESEQSFWGPRTLLGSAHTNGRDRSRVDGELALRPGFSPQARMPPTARPAPRGAEPGSLVLTAGPSVVCLMAFSHRPGGCVSRCD